MQTTFGFIHSVPSCISFIHVRVVSSGAGLTANAQISLGFQWMSRDLIFLPVLKYLLAGPVQHGVESEHIVRSLLFEPEFFSD